MSIVTAAADALRFLSGKPAFPKTAAVVVAAGNSTRMRCKVSKQLLTVAGLPVIVRALRAFEDAAVIDEIILVARAEDKQEFEGLCREHGITKLKRVVEGGENRTASVTNGFVSISPDTRFVAIHDGARCLITPDMIDKVCHAAYRFRAASAACRVSDTVKRADVNGFVTATVDRTTVWLAQTPQVFSADLYRAALVQNKGQALTDDNQLIEALPHPVKLVDCGSENFKITVPGDIARAEFMLQQREEKA